MKPNRFYSAIHKIAEIAYRFCFFLGAIFAAGMTWIVIINIVSRYFLNYAISWTEEIARYLMIWMVMLGAAMGVRCGMHFRMEMIENWGGNTLKYAFNWATRIVSVLLGLILVWHGCILLPLTNYQYATATQIPMSWVYISLPLAGLLMIFFVLEQSLKLYDRTGNR